MTEHFEKLVIGGKFGLVISFLVMSFINGHKEYVQNHPRKFVLDALITGLARGLGSVFLCYTRGRPDLIFNSFLFTFLFFFFYSVCREFSGYFAFMGKGELTSEESKQEKMLKTPITIIGGILISVALLLAVMNHVSPDYSQGILSNSALPLVIELVVFTLIASSGELVVGTNHGDDPTKTFLMGAALFSFSHLVLQYGGFYNLIFVKAPIVNNFLPNTK